MTDSRYDQEYDDITSVGLPANQLALIIGVNAVISLIISVTIVLIAGQPTLPDISISKVGEATNETIVAEQTSIPASPASDKATGVPIESTPVQSVDYTVSPGDSLSLIADKFSVSLYDLMVANGLTDEDFIQAGQQLTIPVGGIEQSATATFTPIPQPSNTPLTFNPPTPLPTNAVIPVEPAVTVAPTAIETATIAVSSTPTPLPSSTPAPFDELDIIISEVISPGEVAQETLVLLNNGASTSLNNWKLEGSPLAIVTLPDIFLFSRGSIRIHTIAGENTSSDLYLNQIETVWPPGTVIILSNDKNIEISRFTVAQPPTQ